MLQHLGNVIFFLQSRKRNPLIKKEAENSYDQLPLFFI